MNNPIVVIVILGFVMLLPVILLVTSLNFKKSGPELKECHLADAVACEDLLIENTDKNTIRMGLANREFEQIYVHDIASHELYVTGGAIEHANVSCYLSAYSDEEHTWQPADRPILIQQNQTMHFGMNCPGFSQVELENLTVGLYPNLTYSSGTMQVSVSGEMYGVVAKSEEPVEIPANVQVRRNYLHHIWQSTIEGVSLHFR